MTDPAPPGPAGEVDTCAAPFRVRFDEGGPDDLIRTAVLLRYTQDLAGLHATIRGFSRAWHIERGLTWLVRAAEVEVTAPIAVGTELVGTTRVVGGRRVWARRRTEFVDAAGNAVARVHIDWLLVGARGAPTRIPASFDSVFGAPPVSLALARVDLADPPDDRAQATLTVRPQELDPMDHVNNAVYADWLDEAVEAAGDVTAVRAVPRVVRLEYARAAEPRAQLATEVWRDGRGWSCRITDAGGSDLLRARLEPGADAVHEPAGGPMR